MSETTQTLHPKEQNRMRFIRTDRAQDHGTRRMDTIEHAWRKEASEDNSRRKAFLDRKFGEEAIREALSAAKSPAELEDHADQLLLEAGDDDLVHESEANDTFVIPVSSFEEDAQDIIVRHNAATTLPAGAADDFRKEFRGRTRKYEDANRTYEGTTGDDEDTEYLDGFSVKDRP